MNIPLRDISTFIQPAALLAADSSPASRPAPRRELISLYIGDHPSPVLLHLVDQLVLGRFSSTEAAAPRIDLTPYGAFRKGVSRSHALLSRDADGIYLQDLNSANGTWLNYETVLPDTRVPLRSGDRIHLSQLEIEIYLPEPETAPLSTSSTH